MLIFLSRKKNNAYNDTRHLSLLKGIIMKNIVKKTVTTFGKVVLYTAVTAVIIPLTVVELVKVSKTK